MDFNVLEERIRNEIYQEYGLSETLTADIAYMAVAEMKQFFIEAAAQFAEANHG